MKFSTQIYSGLLLGIISFLLINLLVIDYFIITQKNETKTSETEKMQMPSLRLNNAEETIKKIPDENNNSQIIQNLRSEIYEATRSLTLQLVQMNSDVPASQNENSIITAQTSSVKEYYIPLGTGSTTSTEWIDLPGVEAFVAPDNYRKLKSMYFEAGLLIPTGNGQILARLKNITDNVSLIESEVKYEGSTGKLVSSGKIPLPFSTKLYRVQIRSSIGAEVVIAQSRIKLFVE